METQGSSVQQVCPPQNERDSQLCHHAGAGRTGPGSCAPPCPSSSFLGPPQSSVFQGGGRWRAAAQCWTPVEEEGRTSVSAAPRPWQAGPAPPMNGGRICGLTGCRQLLRMAPELLQSAQALPCRKSAQGHAAPGAGDRPQSPLVCCHRAAGMDMLGSLPSLRH